MNKKANNKKSRLLPGLLLVISSITPIAAQNLTFLRNSPIAWMDEQDRAVLQQTIEAVLAAPNGTETEWLNSATGSHGKVKVLDEREDFGTTCRHIRMRNETRGRADGGVYRLCIGSDGKWKFAPNASDAPAY